LWPAWQFLTITTKGGSKQKQVDVKAKTNFEKIVLNLKSKKMKKNIIFLMIALAGFMFVGVQSVNAQMSYTVNINWSDGGCNCGTVIAKQARVIVTDVVTSDVLDDSGWYKVTGLSDEYTSTAAIVLDTQDRYRVTVAVIYNDTETTVCCSDYDIEIHDGDDFLIDLDVNLTLN
jgi:hypothetical protein